MRRSALPAILLLMLPVSALAQSTPISTIRLAHAILLPGQTQTVTVIARDLSGRPLMGARALALVRYGSLSQTIHMRNTDRAGMTLLTSRPPKGMTHGRVSVAVSVTNGYISIPLSTYFDIRPAGSRTPTSTPTGTRTATKTPTAKPTSGTVQATPTASPPAAGQSAPIVLEAQPVPSSVVAPDPGWIVAYVRSSAGVNLEGAMVRITAPFHEGTIAAAGLTDSNGAVSVLVDTSAVQAAETVTVAVSAIWNGQTTSADVPLSVSLPQPTPVPTASLPTTLAPTDIPTPTSVPAATATPMPAATPVPVTAFTPTATPVPGVTAPSGGVTATPVISISPTNTPVPVATASPQPTATSVPTPTAAPSSTPVPGCPGTMAACMQTMLGIINGTRAQYGLGPLSLSDTQSAGTGSCVGSIGHSMAMEQSGQIWHTNPSYPAASFPTDICGYMTTAGENVGMSRSGNELNDLNIMHNQMMSETHSPTYCTQYVNHACNILSPKFTQVGIGIYYVPSGTGAGTWLTEDFIG